MKREAPIVIVFLTGILMASTDFIPHGRFQWLREFFFNWLMIIGVLAVGLGIVSLVQVNAIKIQRRREGWPYSVITILGLVVMFATGFGWDYRDLSNPFQFLFQNVLIPIYGTMFSLLAFYIASAAFRAFRARSLLATTILVTAVIVMLGQVPVGEALSPAKDFVLKVPNMAGFRAIMIGIGLGAIAMGLKIIFGIERTYMGRD
jgi:hypothetical protein